MANGINIQKNIFWLVSTVVSILFAGNVFFVKRLVDQLDATREVVWELRQEVVVLKFTIEELQRRQKECHGQVRESDR